MFLVIKLLATAGAGDVFAAEDQISLLAFDVQSMLVYLPNHGPL